MPPKIKLNNVNTVPVKKQLAARTADDYSSMSQIEHIYKIPDTYVGSAQKEQREALLFDSENEQFVRANINLPEAIERIFLEIASNASDNAILSTIIGVNPGDLHFDMDYTTIRIRNGGTPIPIEPSDKLNDIIPYAIFGRLLTSSNYVDDDNLRVGCGRNGYGAKLANIFSKSFIVRCYDATRKQYFECKWIDNMSNVESLSVQPGYKRNKDGSYMYQLDNEGNKIWTRENGECPIKGNDSFVEIEYVLDFARFGYTEYPPEAFALFVQHILGFSLSAKVCVVINGQKYDMRNLKKMGKMLWSEEKMNSAVVHYEWDTPDGSPPEHLKKLTPAALEKVVSNPQRREDVPISEILALDTAFEGQCISYVNGLITIDGGVHVNEAYNQLTDGVVKRVNETIIELNQKAERNKKKDDSKDEKKSSTRISKLNVNSIKNHVSMLLICRVRGAKYRSQTKTALSAPKPKFHIPESITKAVQKWHLVDRLFIEMEAKIGKSMETKSRYKKPDKGEDANEAGTKNSNSCVFYMVEGRSAESYPKKRICMLPGGKDFGGYMPCKGKFINCVNSTPIQVLSNEEVIQVKQYLGLEEGVDYTIPANRNKLRYGFIVLTADADKDGKHIIGLWLLFFFTRFRSLIELGMVGYLELPIAKAKKGKKTVERFLTEKDLNAWLDANPKHSYTINYYKGLATYSDDDIRDDLTTAATVRFIIDEEAHNSMALAFNSENADARKIWIEKYRDATGYEDIEMISMREANSIFFDRPISSFINKELVEYSIESLFRAIVSYKSGLKESQTKGIWVCLNHWNYGNATKNKPMKIERLAPMVSEKTMSHHGSNSISEMFAKFAQGFVGSNNLTFFTQESQIGTRHMGGKDCGSYRYVNVFLEWWVKYVFDKKLVEMIARRIIDDCKAEPVWLPCYIPLHVVNGTSGIATGFSCLIPPHNPLDVADWLLDKCNGIDNPTPIKPWFNGFRGKVEVVMPSNTIKIKLNPIATLSDNKQDEEIKELNHIIEDEEPTDEIKEDCDVPKARGASVRTYGNFTYEIVQKPKSRSRKTAKEDDDDTDINIIVDELPIGAWMYTYRKWLESLVNEGLIKSVRDLSDTDHPKFEIRGWKVNKKPTHASLGLIKSIGMGNITMIDDNGYPYKFKSVQEVLTVYYDNMVLTIDEYLEKLKSEIKEKMYDHQECIKLIKAVVEERVVYKNRRKPDIIAMIIKEGIDPKYYDKLALHSICLDEIDNYYKKIYDLEAELAELSKITPQSFWSEKLLAFKNELIRRKYGNHHENPRSRQ